MNGIPIDGIPIDVMMKAEAADRILTKELREYLSDSEFEFAQFLLSSTVTYVSINNTSIENAIAVMKKVTSTLDKLVNIIEMDRK